MELKDWVRSARKHAGLTIEQLAAQLGRSKGAAGFWEQGKTAPSYEQIKKIAELTKYPMPTEAEEATRSELDEARLALWPYPRIDKRKFVGLDAASARLLENAILASAGDLDLDIRIGRSGKHNAA